MAKRRPRIAAAYRALRTRRHPKLPKPKKPKVTFIRTAKPKPRKPSTQTVLGRAAKIALKGVRRHFGI